LGLGDLKSIAREVRQSSGGKLDLTTADLTAKAGTIKKVLEYAVKEGDGN
jgi:hypothetical protein